MQKPIRISLKRVGKIDKYIIANMKNCISFTFRGKEYKVSDRIDSIAAEKLCASPNFDITVRA